MANERGGAAGLTVEKMFTAERLEKFKVSSTVRTMTVKDLKDMEEIFGPERKKVSNNKVTSLTTHDLVSLEGLFGDYRLQIIANYKGIDQLDSAIAVAASSGGVAAGDSCCCCCTPCCCCSAAAETDPFRH